MLICTKNYDSTRNDKKYIHIFIFLTRENVQNTYPAGDDHRLILGRYDNTDFLDPATGKEFVGLQALVGFHSPETVVWIW